MNPVGNDRKRRNEERKTEGVKEHLLHEPSFARITCAVEE
jgi:hypothetical protein